MNVLASPRFLPALLWLDAGSAAAFGLLQVGASGPLSEWLGLPPGLLFASGLVLLGCAVLAIASARPRPPWRAGVLVLVAANLVWVLGCLELLFAGAPGTVLGVAYLAVHALAVGALALLEGLALRRLGRLAWA